MSLERRCCIDVARCVSAASDQVEVQPVGVLREVGVLKSCLRWEAEDTRVMNTVPASDLRVAARGVHATEVNGSVLVDRRPELAVGQVIGVGGALGVPAEEILAPGLICSPSQRPSIPPVCAYVPGGLTRRLRLPMWTKTSV